MFGLLKQKIGAFVDKLTKKGEEKIEKKESEAPIKEMEVEPVQILGQKPVQEKKPDVKPAPEEKILQKTVQKQAPKPVEKTAFEEIGQAPKIEPSFEEKPTPETRTWEDEKPAPKAEPKIGAKPLQKPIVKQEPVLRKLPEAKPAQKPEKTEKKEVGVRLSIGSKLKQAVFGQVEIKESDVDDLLFEFELAMMESDVAYEVAKGISEDMKKKLVGMRVGREDVSKAIKAAMREALIDYVSMQKPDVLGAIKAKNAGGEPYVVLFVGPNGHGKTTTIAKFGRWLAKNGLKSIFSASDTFRAGSIQQLEIHAGNLGIPVVKHEYGADPSAVAFDTKNAAKARNLNVVLVDSAGRQETNRGLIDEMKKISRVVKPDLKVYIAESIVGNSIVEQIREFNGAIEVDGVILTKVDVDAKGGTVLSIAKTVNKPILFVGTGQSYEDLQEFDPDWLIRNIMP